MSNELIEAGGCAPPVYATDPALTELVASWRATVDASRAKEDRSIVELVVISTLDDAADALEAALATAPTLPAPGGDDSARLDYIERTFSGMTNRERYLPVKMIWGKGAMGRTLREACDKYMARDASLAELAKGDPANAS